MLQRLPVLTTLVILICFVQLFLMQTEPFRFNHNHYLGLPKTGHAEPRRVHDARLGRAAVPCQVSSTHSHPRIPGVRQRCAHCRLGGPQCPFVVCLYPPRAALQQVRVGFWLVAMARSHSLARGQLVLRLVSTVRGPAASESTAVLASARSRPLWPSSTLEVPGAGCAPSAVARPPPPSSVKIGWGSCGIGLVRRQLLAAH